MSGNGKRNVGSSEVDYELIFDEAKGDFRIVWVDDKEKEELEEDGGDSLVGGPIVNLEVEDEEQAVLGEGGEEMEGAYAVTMGDSVGGAAVPIGGGNKQETNPEEEDGTTNFLEDDGGMGHVDVEIPVLERDEDLIETKEEAPVFVELRGQYVMMEAGGKRYVYEGDQEKEENEEVQPSLQQADPISNEHPVEDRSRLSALLDVMSVMREVEQFQKLLNDWKVTNNGLRSELTKLIKSFDDWKTKGNVHRGRLEILKDIFGNLEERVKERPRDLERLRGMLAQHGGVEQFFSSISGGGEGRDQSVAVNLESFQSSGVNPVAAAAGQGQTSAKKRVQVQRKKAGEPKKGRKATKINSRIGQSASAEETQASSHQDGSSGQNPGKANFRKRRQSGKLHEATAFKKLMEDN